MDDTSISTPIITVLLLTIAWLLFQIGSHWFHLAPPDPTPENAGKYIYRDESGVCYKYYVKPGLLVESAAGTSKLTKPVKTSNPQVTSTP